jgi:trehalose 6-phosphate phosphatase
MLPDLTRRSTLFLDLDGTLAPIAEEPDSVVVPPAVREVLRELRSALDGAVAIVSGRAISDVDRLMDPLVLPVAGVHGLERRTATGQILRHPLPDLGSVVRAARRFADQHPGLLVEEKPGSVALHFRKLPSLGGAAAALIQEALANRPDLVLLTGKMVVEAKSAAAHTGHAVAAFLVEEPFAGRVPLYAGDDMTDEPAMNEAQSRGGTGIKIGPGPTLATARLPDPMALWAWLQAQHRHLAGTGASA